MATKTRSIRILTALAGLALALALLAAPAAAVRDVPGAADSTRTRFTPPEHHFGAATSWMVGSTLLEQGDLAGALPYLMQAWRMSPGEKDLGLVCRDVLFELGYGNDALDVSRRLVADHADDPVDGPSIRERHAAIQAALERYDDALAGIRALRAEHPDSLRYLQLEAEIQLRAEDWDAAVALFSELRDRDPEQAPALTATLAGLAVRRGDDAEARRLWREALARWPEDTALRTAWIRFALDQGWDEQALAAAAEAPPPGPHPGVSWLTMTAGLLIGEGREAVAHDWLLARARAGDLGPDDTVFLCRILASREDEATGLELLDAAVDRWPDHARLHMFRGEFLAASDRMEEAARESRRARELAPQDPDVLFSLLAVLSRAHPEAFAPAPRTERGERIRAEILDLAVALDALDLSLPASSHMILGGTYDALERLDDAERHFLAAAEDPGMARDAGLSLSFVYERQGRDEDLLRILEEIHAAHPDDPVVQNALGYSLADLDRELERAERLIRAALQAEPENPAFLDSLGWALFRQGDAAGGFDYLVRAANALPDDPVILEHLARVLTALGQPDRAAGVVQRALAAGADPADLQDLLPETTR